MAIPAMVRRYWLPMLLSAAGFLFQLLVLPKSFPPSHYDVLGIKRFAPAERVAEAYEQLSKEWLSETNHQSTVDIIKIRYAYELLTNPILKRDYDLFGLDHHMDVLERVKEKYQKEHFLKIDLPLLKDPLIHTTDYAFNVLTDESFMSSIAEEYPLLIMVYSKGSPRSAQFIEYWKQIGTRLEGVTNTAMVELGDVQLSGYFAEKMFLKQPFFRNGIPALVAYPANCRSPSCYMRYPGELFVDSIVDWVATSVVGLPRILYYSKETLGPQFIGKTSHHKVKVIFFSSTGERATPFLRQAAQEYSSYAAFAFVLLKEDESQIWWNSLGVESAPALVFLKGPGSKPVVYHGTYSKSEFTKLMDEHKHQELPQLRSDASLKLGCDARGHSRAGNETMIWYCVIVAGRPGVELSKKRQILRKAQDQLISADISTTGSVGNLIEVSSAAYAFKDDRLTFVWLDGEVQKKICAFYLATGYNGACGPRGFGDENDKPELFIVRFQRNATYEALKAEKTSNLIETLQGQDTTYASQLVARYNGPDESQEINKWISRVIKDGDTREIPYFTSKVPDLVPEETSNEWSSAKTIRSAGKSLKERVQNSVHFRDYLTDPRVGPALLLCACISLGTIWLKNSRPMESTPQGEGPKDKARKRPRPKLSTELFGQPTIPDPDPKDARQWEMTDSDSD